MAADWLVRLRVRGLPVDDPPLERLLDTGSRVEPTVGEPRLARSDLHVRHLLADADGAACGVIDWDDVCLADPAVDLWLAYVGFAGPSRAALLSAYGEVSAERELRARVLAVCLIAVLAEYAAAEGHDALLTEAPAGLRRVTG